MSNASDALANGERFVIAMQMFLLGFAVAPGIFALLALAYVVKTALGFDLMDGPSPIHQFIDAISDAIGN